jgi:hypothetical protein
MMTKKAKPGRGRPAGRIQDTQLQMRASAEFLKRIDDWRDQQPDNPPRSEGIRRLIEAGLVALAPRKAKAKP